MSENGADQRRDDLGAVTDLMKPAASARSSSGLGRGCCKAIHPNGDRRPARDQNMPNTPVAASPPKVKVVER